MTTVTILPERIEDGAIVYCAIAGTRQSKGKTAGEALDALTKQLKDEESGTLVIVQSLRPDEFFTSQQQQRLNELMADWRAARDAGDALLPEAQRELEGLIEAELEAATKRADRASDELSR